MKSVLTHPTPQHVYDAIQVVVKWCWEIGAVEALIAPTGGAAFHAERQSDQFARACAEIERLEGENEKLRGDLQWHKEEVCVACGVKIQ